MRCQHCDYSLWNLTARACTECGTDFKPSEYTFSPNKVCFCCPDCQQTYFGQDAQGHLQPPTFDCVQCGQQIHMDEMVLRPAPGASDAETMPPLLPWADRKGRWISDWWRTCWMAMIRPHVLGDRVLRYGAKPRALSFFSVTQTAVYGVVLSMFFVLMVSMMTLMGVGMGAGMGIGGVLFVTLFFVLYLVAALVFTWIYTMIWALTAHLILKLTGPIARPLGHTMNLAYYSSGANIVTVVPCFGMYFGWIWWLVSAIIMMRVGQQVAVWRAVLAGLALPLLVLAGMIALYSGAFAVNAFQPGITTLSGVQMPPEHAARMMNQQLQSYAIQNRNELPDHAARLLVDGRVMPEFFLPRGSAHQASDVQVAGYSLEVMRALSPEEQGAAADLAAAQLPADVIAHRLGAFVFTYHGINPADADGDLWLAVLVDGDPDSVHLLLRDGRTRAMSRDEFEDRLRDQNRLRQRHELPALDDPRDVTHERPMRAGKEA